MKEKQRYTIESNEYINNKKETQKTNIITTPFADDFNLISRNQKLHKKLLTNIEAKAKTMGLTCKPKKCRSLFICSGKITNVTFALTDPYNSDLKVHIETTHESPFKFLGSLIRKMYTPKDYLSS